MKLDAFKKELYNVMEYRNAFAHGHIVADYDSGFLKIAYHSGTNKRINLDNEYWTKLVVCFNNVINAILTIEENLKNKNKIKRNDNGDNRGRF